MLTVHHRFHLYAGILLSSLICVLTVADLQRGGHDLIRERGLVVPLLVHGQLVLIVFLVAMPFFILFRIAVSRLLHGLLHQLCQLLLGPDNLGIPDRIRREHGRGHPVDLRLGEVPARHFEDGHGGDIRQIYGTVPGGDQKAVVPVLHGPSRRSAQDLIEGPALLLDGCRRGVGSLCLRLLLRHIGHGLHLPVLLLPLVGDDLHLRRGQAAGQQKDGTQTQQKKTFHTILLVISLMTV